MSEKVLAIKNPNVTISKGVAIILMVLGHSFFSELGIKIIYMFHMPLFFFFSGYCFKTQYLETPFLYLKKKLSGIWWPYMKYGIIFLIAHNIFLKIGIYTTEGVWGGHNNEVTHYYMLNDYLGRLYWMATRMEWHEQLLGGFWFLKVLFWASIIGWLVQKFFQPKVGVLLLILISIIAVLFNKQIPFFGIGQKELVASVFYMAGFIYRQKDYLWHNNKWFILISFVIITVCGILNPGGFLTLNILNIGTFILCGTIGSIAMYGISNRIAKIKWINNCLVYVGNNTLSILSWHFLSFKLVSILIILFYGIPMNRLANFPVMIDYSVKGWWVLYVTIGITVPLLLSFLGDKMKTALNKVGNYKRNKP